MKKNRAMEFYRFAAAVMILCYHCYWFAFRDDGTQFIGFYLFVELFFILSGFLMMASVRAHVTDEMRLCPAKTTAIYMRGRLRQIYPHHLLSWIIVAAESLFLVKTIWPIELFKIGIPELLLVNIFGFICNEYINIVCWYLSGLVFASLILYYLAVRCEKTFIKIIAPIIIVFCYGTIFSRKWSLATTIMFMRTAPFLGFMRSLADMTVGCVCYVLYERLKDTELPMEDILSTVTEGAVMLASAVYMYGHSGKWDFAFVPMFAVFVISVFRGKSLFTKLFDNSVSEWLGRQSFAYFLNNIVVIYPVMYLFPNIDIFGMCLICVPTCLVFSVISGNLLKKFTDYLEARKSAVAISSEN